MVGNWEKLIKDEGEIDNFGAVKDALIRKVFGSELTAINAPNSYLVINGSKVVSIANNDGEKYAFKHRDGALLFAKLRGLTQNNVYRNSPRD